MTDRNELRRLVEASKDGFDGQWYKQEDIAHMHFDDYIAAASPEVVMGLLDSIEVLEGWYAMVSGQRRAAEADRDQLRAVLGKIAEFDPAVTHGWAVHVRETARRALGGAPTPDYRAVAVRLKDALEDISHKSPADPDLWMLYTQDIVRSILADPEVQAL